MSIKCPDLNDDNTFRNAECLVPNAEFRGQAATTVANAFDPDQTRSSDGTFSAEAADATSAAHKATAEAYTNCTAESHERAARLHRVAAMRQAEHGHHDHAALLEAIARGHDRLAARSQNAERRMQNAEEGEENPEARTAFRDGEQIIAGKPFAAGLGNPSYIVNRKSPAAPALNPRPATLVLGNASAINEDGWGLIAPFGEHPKTRVFRENGLVKEQQFIQVLDNDAANAMTAKENSFFGRLKRAVIGIPVFKGHGDLQDADPAAITNETQKIKLGVVDQIRKTARGIEAHFALDNDGVKAVTQEGYKYPSAFWWVLPNGRRGNAILARPFKLISVALTPYPNISGVESLANAVSGSTGVLPVSSAESGRPRPQQCSNVQQYDISSRWDIHAAAPGDGRSPKPSHGSRDGGTRATSSEPNTNTNEPDMKLIAGWLRARGIAVGNAENPTEAQVLDSLETLITSTAGEVAALGNENSTLTGQLQALTADCDAQKHRADQSATALSNEQSARKADRKAAAAVIVDVAIRSGIKSVAERAAAIEALANSADFAKAADELLKNTPAHTTTRNGRDVSGKQSAAPQNEHAAALLEYNELFSRELPLAGQNPVKAHDNVMAKYPALAEKLRPAKP